MTAAVLEPLRQTETSHALEQLSALGSSALDRLSLVGAEPAEEYKKTANALNAVLWHAIIDTGSCA